MLRLRNFQAGFLEIMSLCLRLYEHFQVPLSEYDLENRT